MYEICSRAFEPPRLLCTKIVYLTRVRNSRWRPLTLISALLVAFGMLCSGLFQKSIAFANVARIPTKTYHAAQDEPLIPPKIWQIYLRPANSSDNFQTEPAQIFDAASWLARNPDYSYHLVGDQGASRALRRNRLSNHRLRKIYDALPNVGMKSDLLRYLILADEGGVYSDTDVEALRPIDTWIPAQHTAHAKAVIGIEFDRLNGSNRNDIHEDMQFCQWTIAVAPNHPLLYRMLKSVVSRLDKYSKERSLTIEELKVTSWDVLNLTGPSAWTDAIFEQLRTYQPNLTSLRNLTGLTTPTLIGDILILPIDAFGMGQGHSNSTNDGSTPNNALVRHKFHGSWRKETYSA